MGKKDTIYVQLGDNIKISEKDMVRITVLINLTNYENIRIESSEYDDAEKCFQEIEDTVNRITTYEAQNFNDNYIKSRKYKDKLGVFKKNHPAYFK